MIRRRRFIVIFLFDKRFRLFLLSVLLITLTTIATFRTSQNSKNKRTKPTDNIPTKKKHDDCPPFGCPIYPQDWMDDKVQEAISAILKGPNDDEKNSRDMAALTRTSNRKSEINQDRGVIISPFRTTANDDDDHKDDFFVGIFDGHSDLGDLVAEYAVTEVPTRLASKILKSGRKNAATANVVDDETIIRILKETFIEVDATTPNSIQGGCTGSIIYRRASKLYVANTGDSRSFVASFRKSTGVTDVRYVTRADKAHLPEEKRRIEAAGGNVHIPPGHPALSRVVVFDTAKRESVGLAMSRSIGDFDHGSFGVIAEPLVDVLDIDELLGRG
eukprot:CAMPEP_0172496050 /NCGR_PEP_ID=MMETSP1066-20121228/80879_1 /TAXON_ID=671091 /ORGANISM="Coscinodiscus wailesii, Strain CCMP2513" /LENGTH=330 /DNA_ID=CAMNT_0013268133 /DNA_START=68 /DNA_END=1057 /DNA_ORIENTATION=+